jgi:hypothetical protein
MRREIMSINSVKKEVPLFPELQNAWGFHDSLAGYTDCINGYSFGQDCVDPRSGKSFRPRWWWEYPCEEEVLQIWKQAKNVTQWRAR